jgi:hypothetical protein
MGVKVDKAKAAQLYGLAAEQGFAEAQYSLGSCYATGEGVKVDKANAAQLWGQAAEQGLAKARFDLGICYHFGDGVKMDEAKAAQLYGQAAEQDHCVARCFLGLCYEHGRGVPHDMSKAAALYSQASKGGCANAKISLGLCFEKGRGVEQSLAKAEQLLLATKSNSSAEDDLPILKQLLKESLSHNAPHDTPSAAATARIQYGVHTLNIAARQGHAGADKELKLLASRRDVVSVCCVGCGAVRKLKTCAKCRIARFCDKECSARMWPAHKASCKAWRAESAADAEQS